jgi:PIN domain nuclease of toxin-antitoxin system
MRLLLDTHTLLWALAVPERLSGTAAALIRDTRNVVLVSAASAWEISTKQRLGKLPSAGPIVAAYAAHLARLRAEELPIRGAHALLAGGFTVDYRDPFDRMLAAQAILEGLPLLTNDPAFSAFANLETIW